MRELFTICALFLLSITTYAQESTYVLEVKSIKNNGHPQYQDVLKTKHYSIVIKSNEKGAMMNIFIETESIRWGKLSLIDNTEIKETQDRNAGYLINYVWESNNDANDKRTYAVVLRVILTEKGDKFVLDMKRSNNILQYTGEIIDISNVNE